MVSARKSGVSPGITTTVVSSSTSPCAMPSRASSAASPTSAASPVPRWRACSVKSRFAQSGALSRTSSVTRRAPCPTTTIVLAGATISRAWMTCSTIGRPQITCSGLGRDDFMRVPCPAARMMTEVVMAVVASLPPRDDWVTCAALPPAPWFRGEDSNPYKRDQNPLSCR